MKIGIYTDCHYSSKEVSGPRYHSQSLRKIKEAYEAFEREGCELAICLGDLIDTEPHISMEIDNLTKIGEVIRGFSIPTVCLMGNHDAFVLTDEQFYKALGIPRVDELSLGDKRLLFLDACYFKSGRHYKPGDSDWTDSFFPYEEELCKKLTVGVDTYIFVHQNIDPQIRADHRIFNADRLIEIINKSGTVKAVFQGHYHPGHTSEHGGIKYITLPAMCENENAFWCFNI